MSPLLPRPATAVTTTQYARMTKYCTRCGEAYTFRHTCAHPLHSPIDPQCVYTDPAYQTPDSFRHCDVCRPIRAILAEGSL